MTFPNEAPQTAADLERLIATIQAMMAANPAKAPECKPLLDKLQAHLGPRPPGGRRRTAA